MITAIFFVLVLVLVGCSKSENPRPESPQQRAECISAECQATTAEAARIAGKQVDEVGRRDLWFDCVIDRGKGGSR